LHDLIHSTWKLFNDS